MDTIQIIIFIVAIAVAIGQQILKANKKEKTTSPKEVLADMFPEVEEEKVIVPSAPVIRKPNPPRKQHQPITAPKQTVSPKTTNNKPDDTPIKLKTKEEARRAFIYSEIFNRKY